MKTSRRNLLIGLCGVVSGGVIAIGLKAGFGLFGEGTKPAQTRVRPRAKLRQDGYWIFSEADRKALESCEDCGAQRCLATWRRDCSE